MQWQPIETAPKDGTEVILCRATDADGRPIVGEDFGVFVQVAGWWTDRWVVYCSTVLDPDLHFEPTHWMPLPAPPDTQRTDPPKCDWHRDEFGNWFSGCSETMPDFTPWKGTDPKGSFCPKCGKIITVRVHDKP